MNRIHPFIFRAIGNLGRDPEMLTYDRKQYVRFCLVGNDEYIDADDAKRTGFVTSMWFTAIDDIAVALMREGRKGDQLFVEGTIARDHIIREPKHDNALCLFVTGYRFGAKRRRPDPSGAGARRELSPSDPTNSRGGAYRGNIINT
jgi:hypothetical protein